MSKSKLQQVFSHIILKSLLNNGKLYKQAKFFSLSGWRDFIGSLLDSFRVRRQLRNINYLTANENYMSPGFFKDQLGKAQNKLIERLNIASPRFKRSEIQEIMGNIERRGVIAPEDVNQLRQIFSPWQIVKENPLKATGLGVGSLGALGGTYYLGRSLMPDISGAVNSLEDKVEKGLSEGIQSGLQRGLQRVGLVDERGKINLNNLITPQLLSQAGSSLGSGVVSSIADPLFTMFGIDPNQLSPTAKLLILLILAGGTLGIGSNLVSR
jgi:hypothetical protein